MQNQIEVKSEKKLYFRAKSLNSHFENKVNIILGLIQIWNLNKAKYQIKQSFKIVFKKQKI